MYLEAIILTPVRLLFSSKRVAAKIGFYGWARRRHALDKWQKNVKPFPRLHLIQDSFMALYKEDQQWTLFEWNKQRYSLIKEKQTEPWVYHMLTGPFPDCMTASIHFDTNTFMGENK